METTTNFVFLVTKMLIIIWSKASREISGNTSIQIFENLISQ